MNISYDYEELLQELKEDLEDEVITEDSVIQILRNDSPLIAHHFGLTTISDYYPIIDWFYDEDIEEEQFGDYPTEELDYYFSIKNKLESVIVKDVLSEMTVLNKII